MLNEWSEVFSSAWSKGLKKLIHSTGKAYLYYLAQEEMVLATEGEGGSYIPEEERIYEISILVIYQEIARVMQTIPIG